MFIYESKRPFQVSIDVRRVDDVATVRHNKKTRRYRIFDDMRESDRMATDIMNIIAEGKINGEYKTLTFIDRKIEEI